MVVPSLRVLCTVESRGLGVQYRIGMGNSIVKAVKDAFPNGTLDWSESRSPYTYILREPVIGNRKIKVTLL